MCIDDLDECIAQLLSIGTCHLSDTRQVILGGVTVHLPVDIYSTLVLSDRIIVAFLPHLHLLLCGLTFGSGQFADGGVGENLVCRND